MMRIPATLSTPAGSPTTASCATAIILTTDHGENLGELGIYGEHGTADNITCRIPFIIKGPGCVYCQVDSPVQYSFDLMPTLAELLGLPAQPHRDSQSYAGTIRTAISQSREALVLSQMTHAHSRWDYSFGTNHQRSLFPETPCDKSRVRVETDEPKAPC